MGAPLALLVALVVTKWWGKVVALNCLSLSQIGFTQNSERDMLIYLPDLDFKMSMLGRLTIRSSSKDLYCGWRVFSACGAPHIQNIVSQQ